MTKKILFYYLTFIALSLVSLVSCEKEEDNTVKDIDGNIYHTVTIGTQVWMVENLKTTKYNDGTEIPNVKGNEEWNVLTTGAYCWYNNDKSTYKETYGALYNWHAVNTGKLCPTGWHVPTSDEWLTLISFLGGENAAGCKLKETDTIHWQSPNAEATNESGFTALPGGYRFGGVFDYLQGMGYWWSSSELEYEDELIKYYCMDKYYCQIEEYFDNKNNGLSVRCIKD